MAVWSLFVQYPNREPVLRELVAPQSLSELRDALEVFDDQHLLIVDPHHGQFPVERVSDLFDGCSLRVAVPRRRVFVSRSDGLIQHRPVVWYPGAGAEQIESAIVKACGFAVGTAIEVMDSDVAVVISATIPNDSALTAVPLAPEGGSVVVTGSRAGSGQIPLPPNGCLPRSPESPRGLRTRTATTPTVPPRSGTRAGANSVPRSAAAPAGPVGAGQRARSGTPQHPGGAGYPARPGTGGSRTGSPSRPCGGGYGAELPAPASPATPGLAVAPAPAPSPEQPTPGSAGTSAVAAASAGADEHCVHILAGHAGPVLSLCTVGDVLFTGSQDCNIMIWDLNNLQYIGTLPGHTGPVKCMAATLGRKMLCSGSQDKTIKVWSLETFSSTKTFLGHSSEVNTMTVLENSEVLLSGGEDRSVRVWDLLSLTLLASLEQAHLSGIFAVKQLDGSSFVTASRDRTIKVWTTSTWQARCTLNPPHYDAVSDVAAGSRQGRLFSASRDRSIRRWDVQSLESDLQLTNAHSDWITCLALSPSENSIFSGCRDATVKVWDAELCCMTRLTGHRGPITALLTVDGHLFSASHDRTVRVWRVDQFEKS